MEILANESQAINTQDEEAQHCIYAMQLLSSSVLPMVLNATLELDVFEILAKAGPQGKLSPHEIACHISTKNPDAPAMLDRMLRLLASYSILTCSVTDVGPNGDIQRHYGLAPVAKYFVRNEDGVSFSSLLASTQSKVVMSSWYELKNAVIEGGVPFERAYGASVFDCTSQDPILNELFNKSMIDHTNIVMKQVLDHYNGFEHLKTLVDVGGGLGMNISMIKSKYPTIKGINFDLPHVISEALVLPGIKHIGGDMFESIPNGHAIFLKWILHDWSDGQCINLLKNCYKALPEDGKVIVVEYILPANPDTSTSTKNTSQFDLLMMAQFLHGKERSQEEFLALAIKSGFKGIRLVVCVCNMWVMEFYK